MTMVYTGWGSSPQIQTTDSSKDLYYNSQAPAGGKEFSWVSDVFRGELLRITVSDAIAADPSNCKVMAGPQESNTADVYLRWSSGIPVDLPRITGGYFQFAEYPYGPPYNGPPPLGMMVDGDSGTNCFALYLDPTHPDRWAWIGPPVDGNIHDFILHVRNSTDPTVGLVELWFDGAKQTFRLNGKQTLNLATIAASNATGPQRLILDAYCSRGLLTAPVSVLHSSPVFGTALSDVATYWRLHNANQDDRSFMSVDAALAAARPIVAAGKAVFLTREGSLG